MDPLTIQALKGRWNSITGQKLKQRLVNFCRQSWEGLKGIEREKRMEEWTALQKDWKQIPLYEEGGKLLDARGIMFEQEKFSEIGFENLDFSFAVFDRCRFENGSMELCYLDHAEISGCEFVDSWIVGCWADQLDWTHTHFQGGKIESSFFVGCGFAGSQFGKMEWHSSVLVNCAIDACRFNDVNMHLLRFDQHPKTRERFKHERISLDIQHTDFSECKVTLGGGWDFLNLENVNFQKSKMTGDYQRTIIMPVEPQ